MLFQTPTSLFWFLPLGGLILLLYLLKMRRRDVRIPATFLWPQMTSDVRANAPFQRLRITPLLLLQMLILAFLVLGVANPLLKTKGLHGKATVIVLDASASMRATDVSPSRYEAARRRIASIISTMSGGDQLALIEAGPVTRVISPLSGDKAKIESLFRPLHATDSPNDLSDALRLAAALVGQRDGARILVLSDGAFPPIKDFSPGKAELLYESFGSSSRNLGITALEVTDTPRGGQLFAGIRNYESAPRKATLSYYQDGKVTDSRILTVPPRQTLGETFPVSPTAQRADIQISSDGDLLQADNHASLFLQGAGTLRVLLVTQGNLFLERALVLESAVRLDRATALPDYERAGTSGDSRYDLILFDGVPPTPVKAPAVWSFGGISSEMPVVDEGTWTARPQILTWKRDHPILLHANNLDGLVMEKGRKVHPKPEGRVLIEGSAGPLMVASEQEGRRRLYTAWNLLESDFPLQVSFPIFISNAIAWLTREDRTSGKGITVRTGQVFSLPLPDASNKNLTLNKPDGERLPLDTTSGIVLVRNADLVGDYTLSGIKNPLPITANLLNEEESDISPKSSLELSGHHVAGSGSALALAEMWRPLVVFALLILTLEWWVFVRRS